MQQGRRSASMKASYEALQLTQGSELGLLGPTQAVTLPPSEIREVAANQVVVATTAAGHSTKKQKKYAWTGLEVSCFRTCFFLRTGKKSR